MAEVRHQGRLPSSEDIVRETFDRLGLVEGAVDTAAVIDDFNRLLRLVWEETLPTLEQHEERAYSRGIPQGLIAEFPDDFREAERAASARGFGEGVLHLFERWYPALRRSFLSVSQSRMQRGGKDFELQIETLFDLANIPYHEQERQNRTDLILPNLETFQRNRNIALVVSVKRTLRERWAEVAEELFNLRSPNVFLFTADEAISDRHVSSICDRYNIHLAVWDDVKLRFPNSPLVLSYSAWARDHLAAARQRWT